MSSLTPIPEVTIPYQPKMIRENYQISPPQSPIEGFIFAICPVCAKKQEDVLVSMKTRVQKIIFCSTNCQVIFQNNIVKISSNKEDSNFNQMRLGYTGKPENKVEEEYLKQTKEKIERNW